MSSNTIQCPKCKFQVEITKAVESQLAERIRAEVSADFGAREKALGDQASELAAAKKSVDAARRDLEASIRSGVEAERKRIESEAMASARRAVGVDLQAHADRVKELERQIDASRKSELEMIKREQSMKDRLAQFDLEVAKQVGDQTDAIRAAAKKQADDEHLLKDMEAKEQNSQLRRQVEELKRKLEQGPQQVQGEALELLLEDTLNRAFPHDKIEEIAKGVNGGDWCQHVMLPNGMECGDILWETKNAKNWNAAWLKKLRVDQREAKAAFAVLVTESMPAGFQHVAEIDEVWVCTRACAVTLGAALRTGLVEVAKARAASEGKQGKIERVYDYLSGTEFRQRVAAVVEQLTALRAGLDSERRALTRIWAAREKQIEGAVQAMNGMYGDFQGIVGSGLPEIEGMSWPQIEDEDA